VGYAGYTPSSECIPIPVKTGPSTFEERMEIKEANQTYTKEYLNNGGYSSLYGSTLGLIKPLADNSNEVPEEQAGESVRSEAADEREFQSKPFLASSLYLNDFKVHQKPQRIALMGVKRYSAQGTTYSDSFELAADLKYGQNWLEEKSLRPKTYVNEKPKWRDVDLKPRPMSSQYMNDFAMKSGEIMKQPGDICDKASSKELFQGTTKFFRLVPNYYGFIPASEANQHALSQVSRMDLKPDSKKFRLFTLQQYSLNVPGCAKFRPSTAYNLSRLHQDIPTTSLSTKSVGDFLSSPSAEEMLKSTSTRNKGILGFFQSGEVSQSSNGIHNAQGFYKLLRPYEGLPRVMWPSSRSESGYRFSKV